MRDADRNAGQEQIQPLVGRPSGHHGTGYAAENNPLPAIFVTQAILAELDTQQWEDFPGAVQTLPGRRSTQIQLVRYEYVQYTPEIRIQKP